ncbi:MAG TPA: MFS transporter [Herpetosiphon sp.]|uniref:Major facilitator superfamily MFS_1 n=1 Tax=Herpetosiphon aurantiacus (strain ATCC 23779 / DSM 785 / 114-95) TaxID=316274 RepID=A9AXF8_HERA2|nr:MFS transporter [Herpetosiphon sp.]ABX06878.1 major facilitator superfamily MFS_1 [Herpetosiphon aurantiacus DSM 785]HBW52772.1 MFS transporter [Herpetosiphon sp.]
MASTSTTPRQPSPLVALRHRDYRLLWSGQLISIAGSQMHTVALHVQVYRLASAIPGANPAIFLGLIGLFQFIPLLLLALRAGLLADRVDRRRLMLVTQSILMGLSLVLAVLSWFGLINLWLLYGIMIIFFSTKTFDLPARQALIPRLVPREVLPTALSLNMIAWQIGNIAGPALGGWFVSYSIALVYLIDAISYGVVVLNLWQMRGNYAPTEVKPIIKGSMWEGLHFVRRTPIIWSTMVLDFIATFCGAATTLLPLFADKVLKVDEKALGLMYAAPAIGALVAALAMSWFGNPRRQGMVVVVSVVLYGLATMVFGLAPSLPIAVLGLAGTGAADTVSAVLRGTIRQLNTPDELRGRATSANMLFFQGGPLLGEVEAGFAASLVGAPIAIAFGGAICVAAAIIIAVRIPSLRLYDR